MGATPLDVEDTATFLEVSILAHPERWALRDIPGRITRAGRVSILAHPERWALLDRLITNLPPLQFQSSPTPKGGRYGIKPTFLSKSAPFQSSPTPKGGRYVSVRQQRGGDHMFQSSPTPKGGRYTGIETVAHIRKCFNPRPPRKVGATVLDCCDVDWSEVSILAHPERWALHDADYAADAWIVFQSSPTPKGGRYRARVGRLEWLAGFNPRPPRKVGATRCLPGTHRRGLTGFNPRPPRKVGATRSSLR